uniref:Uncharacterized protein n=1 Tax=Anopheles epiroticus TaxID=199890 RepID=A0A182PTI0_9DIPT
SKALTSQFQDETKRINVTGNGQAAENGTINSTIKSAVSTPNNTTTVGSDARNKRSKSPPRSCSGDGGKGQEMLKCGGVVGGGTTGTGATAAPSAIPPTIRGSGPNGELTLKDIPVSGISFQEIFKPDHEGPPTTQVIIYKPKSGKGQPTAKVIVTKWLLEPTMSQESNEQRQNPEMNWQREQQQHHFQRPQKLHQQQQLTQQHTQPKKQSQHPYLQQQSQTPATLLNINERHTQSQQQQHQLQSEQWEQLRPIIREYQERPQYQVQLDQLYMQQQQKQQHQHLPRQQQQKQDSDINQENYQKQQQRQQQPQLQQQQEQPQLQQQQQPQLQQQHLQHMWHQQHAQHQIQQNQYQSQQLLQQFTFHQSQVQHQQQYPPQLRQTHQQQLPQLQYTPQHFVTNMNLLAAVDARLRQRLLHQQRQQQLKHPDRMGQLPQTPLTGRMVCHGTKGSHGHDHGLASYPPSQTSRPSSSTTNPLPTSITPQSRSNSPSLPQATPTPPPIPPRHSSQFDQHLWPFGMLGAFSGNQRPGQPSQSSTDVSSVSDTSRYPPYIYGEFPPPVPMWFPHFPLAPSLSSPALAPVDTTVEHNRSHIPGMPNMMSPSFRPEPSSLPVLALPALPGLHPPATSALDRPFVDRHSLREQSNRISTGAVEVTLSPRPVTLATSLPPPATSPPGSEITVAMHVCTTSAKCASTTSKNWNYEHIMSVAVTTKTTNTTTSTSTTNTNTTTTLNYPWQQYGQEHRVVQNPPADRMMHYPFNRDDNSDVFEGYESSSSQASLAPVLPWSPPVIVDSSDMSDEIFKSSHHSDKEESSTGSVPERNKVSKLTAIREEELEDAEEDELEAAEEEELEYAEEDELEYAEEGELEDSEEALIEDDEAAELTVIREEVQENAEEVEALIEDDEEAAELAAIREEELEDTENVESLIENDEEALIEDDEEAAKLAAIREQEIEDAEKVESLIEVDEEAVMQQNMLVELFHRQNASSTTWTGANTVQEPNTLLFPELSAGRYLRYSSMYGQTMEQDMGWPVLDAGENGYCGGWNKHASSTNTLHSEYLTIRQFEEPIGPPTLQQVPSALHHRQYLTDHLPSATFLFQTPAPKICDDTGGTTSSTIATSADTSEESSSLDRTSNNNEQPEGQCTPNDLEVEWWNNL